jgi:hypothetical protein
VVNPGNAPGLSPYECGILLLYELTKKLCMASPRRVPLLSDL